MGLVSGFAVFFLQLLTLLVLKKHHELVEKEIRELRKLNDGMDRVLGGNDIEWGDGGCLVIK